MIAPTLIAHISIVIAAASAHPDAASSSGAVAIPDKALATVLHRVSLDPAALAAAAASEGDVIVAVADARTWMGEGAPQLADADELVRQSRSESARLARRARAGIASDAELEDLAQARQALAAAQLAQNGLLAEATTASVDQVAPAVADRLVAIRQGRLEDLRLPAPYLLYAEVAQAAPSIRRALAMRDWATRNGLDVPEDAAAILALVEADPAVSAALAATDSSLDAIEAVWDSATAVQPQ